MTPARPLLEMAENAEKAAHQWGQTQPDTAEGLRRDAAILRAADAVVEGMKWMMQCHGHDCGCKWCRDLCAYEAACRQEEGK